jgi:hypothetical protein
MVYDLIMGKAIQENIKAIKNVIICLLIFYIGNPPHLISRNIYFNYLFILENFGTSSCIKEIDIVYYLNIQSRLNCCNILLLFATVLF